MTEIKSRARRHFDMAVHESCVFTGTRNSWHTFLSITIDDESGTLHANEYTRSPFAANFVSLLPIFLSSLSPFFHPPCRIVSSFRCPSFSRFPCQRCVRIKGIRQPRSHIAVSLLPRPYSFFLRNIRRSRVLQCLPMNLPFRVSVSAKLFHSGILRGHTRTVVALLNGESLRKLIFRLKPLCDTTLYRLKRRHRSPLGELCRKREKGLRLVINFAETLHEAER